MFDRSFLPPDAIHALMQQCKAVTTQQGYGSRAVGVLPRMRRGRFPDHCGRSKTARIILRLRKNQTYIGTDRPAPDFAGEKPWLELSLRGGPIRWLGSGRILPHRSGRGGSGASGLARSLVYSAFAQLQKRVWVSTPELGQTYSAHRPRRAETGGAIPYFNKSRHVLGSISDDYGLAACLDANGQAWLISSLCAWLFGHNSKRGREPIPARGMDDWWAVFHEFVEARGGLVFLSI